MQGDEAGRTKRRLRCRLYLAAGKCRLVDRTSHIGRDWEFVFNLVMTKRGVQGCAGISTHISREKAIVTYG